jgi:site-specific recombinase XerD
MPTFIEAANAFLANVHKSRSELTWKAYHNVLLGETNGFLSHARKSVKYDDPIDKLTEKHAMTYMQEILDLSPATRQLHAAALRRFYAFLAGNDWATVSQDRLNFLLEGANVLSPVHRQIVYDKKHVREFLEWVEKWKPDGNTRVRRLRSLRDKAFVLTLSESGLRVHEACKLKIKELDFEQASGIVVGKGDKQARFKIGEAALVAIRVYLDRREKTMHVTRDQPVFARHDRRADKKKAQAMSPQTGEAIVHELEQLACGTQTITCHTLRHRFVTRVLEINGNLKAAQILARHTNINVTERYAHLVNEEVDFEFDKAFNAKE